MNDRLQFLKDEIDRDAGQKTLLTAFIREVNHRAEANMVKTNKLEGSHHAAMQAVAKELGL